MTVFQTIAVLLTLAAIGGYVNQRYAKLPATIAHMAFALGISTIIVTLGSIGAVDLGEVTAFVRNVDFADVLLHGMLSFLLFAGALHINLAELKAVRVPVAVLATAGVVIATLITGTLIHYAAEATGFPIPYLYSLLFGSLISPTDPIAVLAILKQADAPRRLYVKIGGESLFNDGVAVVVFLTLLGIAAGKQEPTPASIAALLGWEVLGGAAIGALLGWVTFLLLRSIDEYKVEIMLTLGLVTGGYALAEAVHVSAPICMVTAGLIIGNHGRSFGMSNRTRNNLDLFWELIDDILNSILFMLIGLEMFVIPLRLGHVVLGLLAAGAVLLGRLGSVTLLVRLLSLFESRFEKGTIALLTWGGLRGGLSVAMALSLPQGEQKAILVPMTYVVVLFSIFVQGLSFRRVLHALTGKS